MRRASPQTAYVGLGSNLDDPVRQVRIAIEAIAALQDCTLGAASSLYRSDPLDFTDQPDYINAVIAVTTTLGAAALLAALKSLETRAGRDAKVRRWGPRVIDLDLLLYGDARIDTDQLKLPHPGIAQRSFVLLPLREIAPDLRIPGLPPLAELLAHCPPPLAHRLAGIAA